MKSKIKMTYIPDNDKIERSIIESINDALSIYKGPIPINMIMLTNINTVDINISPGSLFNTSIKENIEYVSQENIMNTILLNIKMNKTLIVLNGYDINLKELRDNIYPMLEKQSIMFSINNISKDKELEIPFTYECTLTEKMEENDWNELLDEFDKKYKEEKNKPKKTESLFDIIREAFFDSLLENNDDTENDNSDIEISTFNLDDASLKDILPKDFLKSNSKNENEIVESASFGNKDHCLDIDLYENGSIRLGADDGNTIIIHSTMLKFLANYLDTADII